MNRRTLFKAIGLITLPFVPRVAKAAVIDPPVFMTKRERRQRLAAKVSAMLEELKKEGMVGAYINTAWLEGSELYFIQASPADTKEIAEKVWDHIDLMTGAKRFDDGGLVENRVVYYDSKLKSMVDTRKM